jgi:hypothetical protein
MGGSACGANWAFAAVALAEAASFSNTGIPLSLSEKQLVDCTSQNNGECMASRTCHGSKLVLMRKVNYP